MSIHKNIVNLISSAKIILMLAMSYYLVSCMAVKGYQKMYLNDAEMELAPRRAEYQEMNFQLYREGASGGNGGKAGGGCGCN
jgi:hypothetical protein